MPDAKLADCRHRQRPQEPERAAGREETFRRLVCLIPEGRVATYGQIAGLAGIPRNARQVGRSLARLGETTVPWHRVVNARGAISERGLDPLESVERQQFLLEEEGVRFDCRGRIDLDRFGWAP